ncbi:MAG: hypothetical protein NXI31_27150 [bacterium]|nr:hypothetical protein [bacterium]
MQKARTTRPVLPRLIVTLGLTVVALPAQVPNPNRTVHPGIAPPAPGAFRQGPAPKFQYADGIWNHGEGFSGVTSAPDAGGWFGHEDGTDLTGADIHLSISEWVPHTIASSVLPTNGAVTDRVHGYLRPAGIPLPTVHPRYGDVSAFLPNGYVDQGAFEVFRPHNTPYAGQKILIIALLSATTPGFRAYDPDRPADERTEHFWWNTYRGFFSPDGLVRDEFADGFAGNPLPGSSDAAAEFHENVRDGDVKRFSPHPIASWYGHPNQGLYYPICVYPVLSVMHRQTELNEQRYLQAIQAVKCLLQEGSWRNPLGPTNALTDQEIETEVVVVLNGGSNGGHQAHWATLRHPELVHGCFSQVINPSIQRLLGEQEMGWAVGELSASNLGGATVGPGDFLDWNQYAWGQGLEIHDLSYPRLFLAGSTYRPACFYVGDEDITSTGTDWIRVVDGTAWVPSGLISSPSPFGDPAAHTFAWMAAENGCHGGGLIEDPYNLGTPVTPYQSGAFHTLCRHAVEQRIAQLDAAQSTPTPALTHQPRTASQQQRGLDDPHEWFFGRQGTALPSPQASAPLTRDDTFLATAAPGRAGVWLGYREAMFIRDGKVYVGSADGLVTSFAVDTSPAGLGRQPLVPIARSQQLGHRAFALTALEQSGTGWSVLVGTRRHLHRLDATTLALQQQVELPWEIAQPHGLQIGDVLPSNPGDEIVFRSVHGGLVFYDTALNPVHEWPEPGIRDFVLQGSMISILSSRRAMIANVTFDANDRAFLVAASKPLPTAPTDPPCQGIPHDLELMKINFGGVAMPALVSFWTNDEDGAAIRVFDPITLARLPIPGGTGGADLQNLITDPGGGRPDLATCAESLDEPIGDHLLVLLSDNLLLLDQFGNLVGHKALWQTDHPTSSYYPFGSNAISIAVGELVENTTGVYQQEIVVATASGRLMWLHVEDIAAAGTRLPSRYDPVLAATSPTSAIQPRCNQALPATWSIARHPGDDRLHLLDQNGAYWTVDHSGSVELVEREYLASESKGWGYVGAAANVSLAESLTASGYAAPIQTSAMFFAAATRPWVPRLDSGLAFFEQLPPKTPYLRDNWVQGARLFGVFGGMFPFRQPGALLPGPAGIEIWSWGRNEYSGARDWGNHVAGLHLAVGGSFDGMWSSTGIPTTTESGPTIGDRTPHHDFRTFVTHNPAMNYGAVEAVRLTTGQTAVVLGCPGGRVRILQPGAMRTGSAPHELGTVDSTPFDLGFGGGALTVRLDTSGGDKMHIWFGTLQHPAARPQHYDSPAGSLADSELVVGAISKLTWAPNFGFALQETVTLAPSTAAPRGGYGVAGLLLADLLEDPQHPGDELVATTMSGDVIVFAADTMEEIWRTHVEGSVGFYDSMVVADLDGDELNELYIAGSQGVWRFEEQ